MTTIGYPNAKNDRPPTKTTVDLTELAESARRAGAQVARALRHPIRPRPLWQREDLFQEPVYAAGLETLEDDSEDEEPGSGW